MLYGIYKANVASAMARRWIKCISIDVPIQLATKTPIAMMLR